MGISTTDSRFTYLGDGTTVDFSFPRKFVSTSDLKVVVTDEDDSAEAVQTLNTHYTVAGSGLSNGVYASAIITFATAPGSDKTISIYRDPALTNETDFSSETDPLAALNRKVDLLTMQTQRLSDARSRSLRLTEGAYAITDAQIAGPLTPGYAVKVKSNGTGFDLGAPTTATVGASMAALVASAELTSDSATTDVDFFDWTAWNGLWPEQFGSSVGTGGDDYAALAAWVNAVKASPARLGFMQAKVYKTSARLPDIDVPGVTIIGIGPSRRHYDTELVGTIIEATSAAAIVWRIGPQASGRNLEGITVKGVCINSAGLAAKAWQVQSVSGCVLDISQFESTTLGAEFGVVSAFDEDDIRDSQDNVIRYYGVQIDNAAPCWKLTGDADANFSINVCDFHAIHYDEVAGIHESSDNNKMRVRCFAVPGGAATNSIEWRGSNVSDSLTCRNEWYGLLSVNLPPVAKGTGTYTYPAHDITVDDPDYGNGSPLPTVEAGAYDIRVPGEQGTSIAAASSADLGRCVGDVVLITGSGATITALGTARAGREVQCIFDGANTLTHNGTSLKLPGGANIATVDGDTCLAISLGNGNWRVTDYVRASQKPPSDGTFSPVLAFATPGDAAFSYSVQAGRYVRIGDFVKVKVNLTFTVTHSTASGNLSCSMPFTSATDGIADVGPTGNFANVSLGAGVMMACASLAQNASSCTFMYRTESANTYGFLTATQLPSGATTYTMQFSIDYFAAP